jgi:hypothetical protein
VRDDAIVVQNGNEKWKIARDKATSISGDLKVGAKVTIYYTRKRGGGVFRPWLRRPKGFVTDAGKCVTIVHDATTMNT